MRSAHRQELAPKCGSASGAPQTRQSILKSDEDWERKRSRLVVMEKSRKRCFDAQRARELKEQIEQVDNLSKG